MYLNYERKFDLSTLRSLFCIKTVYFARQQSRSSFSKFGDKEVYKLTDKSWFKLKFILNLEMILKDKKNEKKTN